MAQYFRYSSIFSIIYTRDAHGTTNKMYVCEILMMQYSSTPLNFSINFKSFIYVYNTKMGHL